VDEPENDWAGEFLSGDDADLPEVTARHRRLRIVLLAVAAVALVVVIVVVTTRPDAVATDGRATARTTAASTASAGPATSPASDTSAQEAPASPSKSAMESVGDAAALRELEAVAATLDTPVALTSPADWDRWLPAGKPFPGADTAEDMATCPRLTDRLEAALGTRMSYWTGTLPNGPGGCTWATVPLSYGPDPYSYPYLASVGFLADGTTTEQMSTGFFHHQGRICPSIAAPAVGDGAFLVRCEELEGTTYALITRDTRTAGIWILDVSAREDAAHPATDLIPPVIDGVVSAFG
jgi:hypothetical protein